MRETKERIEIFDGPRRVASHRRVIDPIGARVALAEHRPPRGQGVYAQANRLSPEEQALIGADPVLADYLAAIKKRAPGRGTLVVRKLARMLGDYPRRPFLEAVRTAAHYGLYDLERLERVVLRQIATDYFVLPCEIATGRRHEEEHSDD